MFDNEINSVNESIEESNRETGFEKRTYTVTEIQEILDISMPTAYSLIKRNLFNVVRVGRNIRISKKSFDEWLDTNQKK
ncbi:MAG: helix-turn-helix domain-containing protein [Clostridia bacterium]|nr:helix-turn-helix domain-containing protein [Clostridia bacterium]